MIANRSVTLIFLSISCVAIFPKFSSTAWNFSSVNLPNDVSIWRFAFWRNRAFFAIPSFSRRENFIDSELTLLEASWPEPTNNRSGFFTTSVDNDVRIFSKLSIGKSASCERLSSVVGLDIEYRGRLWILDSSVDTDCPAKIVIYDLRRNDHVVVRTDLQGIPKNNLKTLVIDPLLGSISGPRGYIGDPGDESIIVYSLLKKRWWRLRLIGDNGIPSFGCTEMAISRKNSLLYMTDTRSQDLFSVDLEISRNQEEVFMENDMKLNTTIEWLGRKMGSSSGLVIDQKGGLHYFLVTEHASVRWNTKHDLKPSSYSILLQSEEVPCITDYRLDNQRNVWGLVNRENPMVKMSSNSIIQGKWNGQFRAVRIFKQNPLAP